MALRSATPKQLHIGLLAGAESLANLGPVVRHLIVGLLDEPMRVTLICPRAADVAGLHLPCPPAEIVRYSLPSLPFLRERALTELAGTLAELELSLLHALDVDAHLLASRLAGQLDLDYVSWVFANRRDAVSLDIRCRTLLAASQPIQQTLLSARTAPQDMIRLLRPGVYQVRSATCFINPSHATAIVAAGRLDNFGWCAAVLEAFARLRQAGRDCVYFLIGNGRAERPLRHLAEKLSLQADLTFVDRTGPEQLTGIIKAADLFIFPAPSDRVEIDLLSAMAGGVPVLTAGASASDFVIPDRTALTFDAGDADKLTRLLGELLDDRVKARALAENALAHLREQHSPSRMVLRLAELYRTLLGAKTSAEPVA